MTEGRGLLTEKERRALAGELSDSYRYKTRSYCRTRIEKMERDVDVLAAEAPGLLEELRGVVCAPADRQPVRDAAGSPERAPSVEHDGSDTDTRREDVSPDPIDTGVGDDRSEESGSDTGSSVVTELDFPTGKDPTECEQAIEAAKEYLKRERSASMREIVRAVMPHHPIGYDVDSAVEKLEAGKRYRGAWWRRIVKPGLEASTNVEKPAPGASAWQYTGSEQ